MILPWLAQAVLEVAHLLNDALVAIVERHQVCWERGAAPIVELRWKQDYVRGDQRPVTVVHYVLKGEVIFPFERLQVEPVNELVELTSHDPVYDFSRLCKAAFCAPVDPVYNFVSKRQVLFGVV